jgi:hypothetical protein
MPHAREKLANYLTDTIGAVVRHEVFDPVQSWHKLYGKPRIFNDLLSSQPLCFKLFAELQQDLELATGTLRRMGVEGIDVVTEVQFEWSPGLVGRSVSDAHELKPIGPDSPVGLCAVADHRARGPSTLRHQVSAFRPSRDPVQGLVDRRECLKRDAVDVTIERAGQGVPRS